MSFKFAKIDEVIKAAKAGEMFILIDDENRENEGDLVIPAEKADANAINFMAKYGRGLICLALHKKRVEELALPLMSQNNKSRHHTAFTVSIEAREGVTTGISAADRAKTISDAINPDKTKYDIVSPGHIFPLVAKEGGVLVRAGHTEAAVDISQLAGLNPSGVICEIMNDDGTMARLPDLIKFAEIHDLKIATIADLIEYRRKKEKLIERASENKVDIEGLGKFNLIIYRSKIEYAEHIALVKGDIKPDRETLVRMHQLDILSDVLSIKESPKAGVLKKSLELINKKGEGVCVILRSPDKQSLSKAAEKMFSGTQGINSAKISDDKQIRDYGIGAQILLDIGVHKINLLSHVNKIPIALEGYDLEIVGQTNI